MVFRFPLVDPGDPTSQGFAEFSKCKPQDKDGLCLEYGDVYRYKFISINVYDIYIVHMHIIYYIYDIRSGVVFGIPEIISTVTGI